MHRDCSGKVTEEKFEETLLQEDPTEYMNEVDSLEDTTFHCEAGQGKLGKDLLRKR